MIKSIKLKDIRSFNKASFVFGEGVNLIVGPNGSGKTTILECVALGAFGRFFSLSRDSQAIRFGQDVGRVEICLDLDDRKFDVEAVITNASKTFKVNSNKRPASEMVGFSKAVYFNPETINLVSGSPKVRRGELDQSLSQVEPSFVRRLLAFKKVLKERNSLLKRVSNGLANPSELRFWDDRFCELSLDIFQKRKSFLEKINQKISQVHRDLACFDGNLSISYLSSCNYERFKESLAASLDADLKLSQTSIGPHRDDFEFLNKGGDHIFYRNQASRGEQRLAAIAFKVALLAFLESSSKQRPVLVLDDVFSELDEGHRKLIYSIIQSRQVFVSATDDKMVPDIILRENKKIILKRNG